MVKKGSMAINKKTNEIVEVISAYQNKPDICREDPRSVAILSVHTIKFVSGRDIGKTQTVRSAQFARQYRLV
tara:strand:+ start:845 stop:1060 length:216 start_codon:yes stop_codon:yes gene_type:complete